MFIKIIDQTISIEDASGIWGLNTTETHHAVRRLIKKKSAKVLTIGPAGEHLCAFASVMLSIGHFAGRTGIGAVMGAKKLKAIAVKSIGGSGHPGDRTWFISNFEAV